MRDGTKELEAHIARLRSLGPALTTEAAPAVARALATDLEQHIHAEQAPDGRPWKKTAAGTPALQNAAKAISVRTLGSTIVARIDGVEARHSLGAVRGKVKRQILPTGEIPDSAARAIEFVLAERFKAHMGGK